MKIRIHFTKSDFYPEAPWAIVVNDDINSVKYASCIRIDVPSYTEKRPDEIRFPHCYVVCYGNILWNGSEARIIPE